MIRIHRELADGLSEASLRYAEVSGAVLEALSAALGQAVASVLPLAKTEKDHVSYFTSLEGRPEFYRRADLPPAPRGLLESRLQSIREYLSTQAGSDPALSALSADFVHSLGSSDTVYLMDGRIPVLIPLLSRNEAAALHAAQNPVPQAAGGGGWKVFGILLTGLVVLLALLGLVWWFLLRPWPAEGTLAGRLNEVLRGWGFNALFKEDTTAQQQTLEDIRVRAEKLLEDLDRREREAAEEAERLEREEAERRTQEEARRLKEAEEARLKAEEETRRQAAEHEAQMKEAEEARLKAEEEARRLAEETEAKLREAEEARLKAEEEARRVAAETEAKLQAAEEARRRAENDAARIKAEEEAARIRAEAEAAKAKAEQEAARLKAEAEAARRQAEAARRQQQSGATGTNAALPTCTTMKQQGKLPKMVVAFDSSTSMLIQDVRSGQGNVTRLSAATAAAANMVSSIDKNVEIGLVEINGCPSAKNRGFFAGAQRGRLMQVIRGINPRQYDGNTPLIDGLNSIVKMVDGVNADAVGVLISDGEDTCNFTRNMDICQLARRIHAQKPKLKIHTILIGPNAAKAACVARITGGRVFSPRDASQINTQIAQAGAEFKQVCK